MNSYEINPPRLSWRMLCRRPSSGNTQVKQRVEEIITLVRQKGDAALRSLSQEIDGRPLKEIALSDAAIREAALAVSPEVKAAIADAARNIRAFHQAQKPQEIRVETAPGVTCIQRPVPIERIGLYIPGGSAPLFSTVLMLAIPARIAGCPEVVLCTPTRKDGTVSPEVLYAASYCGIRQVFGIGGAQAIAAMAYGTETVPQVDKIFGPGNQYVTCAKQMLAGEIVAIDMPAGPSEVMVMADASTPAAIAAADLLSQAEHGPDSQVMLVADKRETCNVILEEVERQAALLPRCDIARKALEKSRAFVFDKLADRIDFANTYAPEHLIIATEAPWKIADKITAAGSVFVGLYTPESAGDYASGTNHTLPTSGWARSFSGVNLDSYYRKMTLQEITRDGLKGLRDTIVSMATAEGLDAHANAVKVRTDE
jgi:histidinol dehydrogenase